MKTILITGAGLHRPQPRRPPASPGRRSAARVRPGQYRGRSAPRGGRGRRRLPPGGRQPAAGSGGVRGGKRRVHRRALPPPRRARPPAPDHRQLVDPGRCWTTPTASASGTPRRSWPQFAARNRRRRGHLPAEERLREMVPAELQLGRRHVLPQHRPRPADPDLRPRPELELVYVDDVVAAFLKRDRRAAAA